MARVGKVPAILAANVGNIATPDNANFVFVFFTTDETKLCVKDSSAAVVKTAVLVP